LLRETGSAFAVTIYVVCAAAVTFAAVLCARETRGIHFADVDADQSRAEAREPA